jgi:hypothetical protein
MIIREKLDYRAFALNLNAACLALDRRSNALTATNGSSFTFM